MQRPKATRILYTTFIDEFIVQIAINFRSDRAKSQILNPTVHRKLSENPS